MLHLFYGNDTIKVRRSAIDFVLTKEQEGARLTRIEPENYFPKIIANCVSAVSLFGGQEVYLIDTPSQDQSFYDEALDYIEAMATSNYTFVVIEGTLLAPEKKKWEKFASPLEFKSTAETKFNVFAMSDALLARDKKSLWILLCSAKEAGLPAEEIIGALWWQLKTLRLVAQSKSATEAGLKDYPFKKAQAALKNFKAGELERLSQNLLKVYHDGHGGRRDTDLALEDWVLRG